MSTIVEKLEALKKQAAELESAFNEILGPGVLDALDQSEYNNISSMCGNVSLVRKSLDRPITIMTWAERNGSVDVNPGSLESAGLYTINDMIKQSYAELSDWGS